MTVEIETYKPFHHYEARRQIFGITVFSGGAEDNSPTADLVVMAGSRKIISSFGNHEPERSELLSAVRALRSASKAR